MLLVVGEKPGKNNILSLLRRETNKWFRAGETRFFPKRIFVFKGIMGMAAVLL